MINWIELKDVATLEKIINDTATKNVVLFKHSTRCSISRMALKNFELDAKQINVTDYDFYFLDLLNHRDVSDAIAHKLSVAHHSPQMLLLENKKCVLHLSHDNIDILKIKEYGN